MCSLAVSISRKELMTLISFWCNSQLKISAKGASLHHFFDLLVSNYIIVTLRVLKFLLLFFYVHTAYSSQLISRIVL